MSKNKEKRKLLEKQHEEYLKKLADYQKSTGHRKPVTRREFLNSGLIAFSGMMFAPSITSLFTKHNIAHAAESCAAAGGPSLAPFVNLNLSGGAALMANLVPMDAGGQPLPSYSIMGLGRTPTFRDAFANNAKWNGTGNGSGILRGIQSAASNSILNRSVAFTICSRSSDDSGTNPMNIAGLVTNAGLVGEKLANLGSRDSDTGVRHKAAFGVTPPAPLRVRDVNDVIDSIGFSGQLSNLNTNQQLRLAKMIKNLSDRQARELASLSGGENLKNLVACATGTNIANVQAGTAGIDPRQNNALSSIWDFNERSDRAYGAMVSNALNGNAGAVCLEMGGYDYHGQNRTNTDQKDFNAGVVIGKTLATADNLNQKVFIHVTTDGSVSSVNSSGPSNFRGDRGGASTQIIIMFDPSGAPQSIGSHQIGNFTAGQAVDEKTIVGNVEAGAAAAFVNWAKFSGQVDLIQKVLPGIFTPAQIDQLLKIA